MATIRGSLTNLGRAATEPLSKPAATSALEFLKVWKWPGHIMGAGAAASGEAAKQTGKGALWMIKQPIAGVIDLFGFTVKAVRKNKVAALAIVGAGTAVYFSNHMRDRAAAQTQQELMAQAAAGGQQACGPAITPEEYAQMEARMKQSGPGQTGFAEAIAAKRESAAVTPQTAASL